MPEIKEIGAVIASREMEFRYEDGRTEKFLLKVGAPYEYGDASMRSSSAITPIKRDAPGKPAPHPTLASEMARCGRPTFFGEDFNGTE